MYIGSEQLPLCHKQARNVCLQETGAEQMPPTLTAINPPPYKIFLNFCDRFIASIYVLLLI